MSYRRAALVVAVLTFAAWPVLAHHDFASTFDWKSPVVLTGTVSNVIYTAPHVKVILDVRDSRGEISEWTLELGSPKALANYGWRENTLLRGQRVTIAGWLARDGLKFISAKSITMPNGRELFGASSFFDQAGACVSDVYCLDDEFSSR